MPDSPYYALALAELGTTGLGTVIEADVLDRTGVPSGDASLRYVRTLNGAGSCEFTLPLDDPFVTMTNFAEGEREIHLYRDGVLVWGGRLWQWEITSVTSVRFMAQGFFSTLSRREVVDDLLFVNDDQLDIAWGLIDYTQDRTGGALGITRDSLLASGVNRSKSYCLGEGVRIADAIGDLAATLDGFDYEVGADKAWRTWHTLRGTDLSATIVFDTNTNVIDMTFDGDATQVANSVLALADGGSCETPTYEFDVDTGSRGTYGLLEDSVTSDDFQADHLFAQAQERLRIGKASRRQPTITVDAAMPDTPDLSDYDLGDQVNFQCSRGFATFDQDFRIIEIDAVARPGSLERVRLTLDGVIA